MNKDESIMAEVSGCCHASSTHSRELGELFLALSKAQGEIRGAIKDSKNPFFKSNYADLASCWEAIREPFSKHQLAVVQTTDAYRDPDHPEAVCVVTWLGHSSGQWLRGKLVMRPVKADPQGYGSCITYARRYALAAIAGVAQVDDDGNHASGKSAPKLWETDAQRKEYFDLLEAAFHAEDEPGYLQLWGELNAEQIKDIWFDWDSKTRAAMKKFKAKADKGEAE
jgi:hypothetical protein